MIYSIITPPKKCLNVTENLKLADQCHHVSPPVIIIESSDDDDIPDPFPFPKTYRTDLDIALLTGTLIS